MTKRTLSLLLAVLLLLTALPFSALAEDELPPEEAPADELPWEELIPEDDEPIETEPIDTISLEDVEAALASADGVSTAKVYNWNQNDSKWKNKYSSFKWSAGCCFVAIAIQIARTDLVRVDESATTFNTTTMEGFNPATFAKVAVSKSAVGESTAKVSWGNISKVVPGFKKITDNKYYTPSSNFSYYPAKSKQNIVDAMAYYLSKGYYPIVEGPGSTFASNGGRHYVAVVEVTDNDVIVINPNGGKRVSMFSINQGKNNEWSYTNIDKCGNPSGYGCCVLYKVDSNYLLPSNTEKYTVTFDPNDGSGTCLLNTISVSKGGSYGTLPTVSRSGYTFDGWYTSATGGTKITSSSTVTISANQVLYAHWTQSVLAYSYDPDVAISQASTLLDAAVSSGAKCATYVSSVLRAGGLTNVKQSGVGDLIDYLNAPSNFGGSIGTVIKDPTGADLSKGDIVALVCTKGGNADYSNGHAKGTGLYYGLFMVIVSDVISSSQVKYYTSGSAVYNGTLTLSSFTGTHTCSSCGNGNNVHMIAFHFSDEVKPTPVVSHYLDINAANFPDPIFREWIIDELPVSGNATTGYYMTEEQVKDVTDIDVPGCGISSVKGIEHFPNLQVLNVGRYDEYDEETDTYIAAHYNKLTSLDVSKNTALLWLNCQSNQLTSLVVSSNLALEYLDCSNNQLTSIDVSKNKNLLHLLCYSNSLADLNLSQNTTLFWLYCGDNMLRSLDLSKNQALEVLHCDNNQLTSLDVSNNAEISYLSCYDNQLTSLDVSNNLQLWNLRCTNNPMSTLTLAKDQTIENLYKDDSTVIVRPGQTTPITNPEAVLTVSSGTVRAGGTQKVSVSISEGSKAEVMEFAVLYDSSKLTLDLAEPGEVMKNLAPTINSPTAGVVLFNWDSLTALTAGGSLLELTFTAKANASGTAAVTMPTDGSAYDFYLIKMNGSATVNIPTAVENGGLTIVEYVLGDVNGDEKVNAIDANLIRRYAAKLITLDATQLLAADVSGDGKVNAIDANLIRRYAAKLINSFPAEGN